MNSRNHHLADIILAVEAEMRTAGLWETNPPSPAALMSDAPFCYDTLEFTQWLQWVFLPRVKLMLERDEAWPNRSDIAPLAMEEFSRLDADTERLLAILKAFDELINER